MRCRIIGGDTRTNERRQHIHFSSVLGGHATPCFFVPAHRICQCFGKSSAISNTTHSLSLHFLFGYHMLRSGERFDHNIGNAEGVLLDHNRKVQR